MTNIPYDALLLSEFRLALIKDPTAELTEDNLVKAMTVNQELNNLGYTLAPNDVVVLSKSASLDAFYSDVKNLMGDVKAAPMYPNFPKEVMALSEAQFRFHQLLHYMSTYGMELMMGEPVLKGWLPSAETTPKTEDDTQLLDLKVIGLIKEGDKYIVPMTRILGKSERMTDKEKMIVHEAVRNVPIDALANIRVRFKQNMLDLFYVIFTSDMESADKLNALHSICQHTGDVWKCMDYALTREGFHFKTSQKRLIVKLLESYPIADFESNIILSDKKAARVGIMLNYLDYNTYSRSAPHKMTVASLRSGDLRSWEAQAEKLIANKSEEAIAFIAKRPGVLLRKLAYLVRRGFSCDALAKALSENADKLSTQTLISVLTYFGREDSAWASEKLDEAHKVYSICEAAMKTKLSLIETPIKGKKVFIDSHGYNLDLSVVSCNDKSAEGGFIRSGLALKLPDTVDRLRFFVYWNDKRRVDVDLHASAWGPDDKSIYIGWNSGFEEGGYVVFSGDITHSDAAEYIDIAMDPKHVKCASANIHLYSGAKNFKDIDECYVGMMAVNKIGEEVKLYNPANCFFSHFLTSEISFLNYGYIDVENRVLIFDGSGSDTRDWYSMKKPCKTAFSLNTYLSLLISGQGATLVDTAEEADTVLVMEKASKPNELSVLDENFFIVENE